jgi:long-subunit fatty acid transport protein
MQLRGGYTEYFFQQAGPSLPAFDANGWYAGLTVIQDITEAISYSISAGHELRLGIQANYTEDWYIRPSVNWKLFKQVTFNTSLGYENGTQMLASQPPAFEAYNWLWVGLGARYELTKKLTVSLNYRLTERASNLGSRGYSQNLVGLQLNYQLQ